MIFGRVRCKEISSRWQCELTPKEDVRHREVSKTMCPLQRGGYESLTVISFVPEKSVCCREVSSLKEVRYKEVSLNCKISIPIFRNKSLWPR